MRKILIRTFMCVLAASGILTFLLLPAAGGMALLFPIILFFCAPFPTFIAILIYDAITKKVFPGHKVYAALFGVFSLLLIYHLGLLLVILVMVNHPWQYFISEYTDEFASFNVPVIIISIFIPIADFLIRKIERDLKEYKEKIQQK
jgi:preprotein translocase subunit SecE